MPERARHLLILGGTGEAAAIARAAHAGFGARLTLTTSFAGRTAAPVSPAGRVRIGGFGGVEGLVAYLERERIDLLIDATHPFAATMSRHARLAGDMTGVPRLVLARPPWTRLPDDRWHPVPDPVAAATLAARLGRRVFLTVGAGDLRPFAAFPELRYLVRLVDRPATDLPLAAYDLVIGRGPFALADERRILAEHGIEVLVCKASGGAATAAKLVAAREASVPVVMVERPPPEPGEAVSTVHAALEWLAARLG
jgi:precorrin-6A/cobalt-precorrin-6A reductase